MVSQSGTVVAAPIRVPLSLRQEEMWEWLVRWPQSKHLFNETVRTTLPGGTPPELARRTIEYLVDRHEPLRTTFRIDDEGTYQSIATSVPVELPVVRLAGGRREDLEAELRDRVRAHDTEPIDTGRQPIFRATLFEMGDDASELVLTIPHLISDQTTDSILCVEMRTVFEALAAGALPQLPALPLQFADYAIWEREWLTEQYIRQGCHYWSEMLRGMPLDMHLPYDRPKSPDGDKTTSGIDFLLPTEVHDGLDRLAKETRSTFFILSVAAVQALLARATGQTDVVVLTTFHGRDRPELERVMGFFAGAALLRSNLEGDPTFVQVIERARRAVLGMLEHHYVPFDRVVAALVDDLRGEGTDVVPQVPVSVEFFHTSADLEQVGMSSLESRPAVEGPTSSASPGLYDTLNPLAFRLFGGDGSWGRISYHDAVFDRSTVERLTADFKLLLAVVADDPDIRLSRLPDPRFTMGPGRSG